MIFLDAVRLAKELNELTHDPDLEDSEMREALRAVLELATDEEVRDDPPGMSALSRQAWAGGHRQAMVDMIDAIADAFNVQPLPGQENSDGGAGT